MASGVGMMDDAVQNAVGPVYGLQFWRYVPDRVRIFNSVGLLVKSPSTWVADMSDQIF